MSNYKGPKGKSSNNRGNRNSFKGDPRKIKSSADTGTGNVKVGKGVEPDGRPYLHNNVEWYGGGSVLTGSACNIPFTYPLGMRMPEEYYGANALITTGHKLDGVQVAGKPIAAPGFMTLTATGTPGFAENAASPVNVAMRKIYANIRKQNSGAANYEPVDLFMYILSMDEIYTMWSHLMRGFGFIHHYSSMNRYYATAAFQAMGIDYDDLSANAARYRTRFNILSAKINSFAVPATMNIFKRHGWLYQNIYMDTPEEKAQSYVVVPAGYRTFEPFELETGGYLEWHALASQWYDVMTMSDWLDILENMIDKMTVNEDMNVMSGDIEKAYGSDSLVKLSLITETLMLAPLYDEGFLNQLENAVICGIPASNDISQVNGNLTYAPAFAAPDEIPAGMEAWKDLRFLNVHNQNPSSDEVLQATRFCVMGGEIGDSWSPTIFGSDIICTSHFVVTIDAGEVFGINTIMTPSLNSITTWYPFEAGTLVPGGALKYMYFILCFERAPEYVFYMISANTAPFEERQIFRSMELDNFAFLDSELLSSIHQAALIHLFGVQDM